MQDVILTHELSHKARCLAANGCSVNETNPMLGEGVGCETKYGCGMATQDNLRNFKREEVLAYCASAARPLWWLDQHAVCHPGATGDLNSLGNQLAKLCG